MCNPTVTSCDTPDHPQDSKSALEAQERPGTPIPGWTNAAGRSARNRAARAARKAAADGTAREASLRGFELHRNILDCALFKAPAFDRRSEARHRCIVLTEPERTILRHLARQAANCGSVWMRFGGFDTDGAVDRELRLVCQAKCGTRACAECAALIRAREAFRVEGPWELFLTFTVPRERASAADCWREVHGWIETLVRELRREVAWSRDERPRLPGKRHNRHIDRWIRANANVECDGKLEYAWVIEPHQDGYPHVHMVVNAKWLNFNFLRNLWSRACGAQTAWVYGEKVYQVDGACRYLCKYISKSTLTIEILALMYGRRLWATSIHRPERPEPLWIRQNVPCAMAAEDEVANAESWGAEDGWTCESSKPGGYALWSRPLPDRVGPIVIKEDDTNYDIIESMSETPKSALREDLRQIAWMLTEHLLPSEDNP